MAVLEVRTFTVSLEGQLLGTFDRGTLTLNDAFVFENITGMTINEMLGDVIGDTTKAKALRALVWFVRFKAGDVVDVASVEFRLEDLVIEVVPDPKETKKSPRNTKGMSDPSAATTE